MKKVLLSICALSLLTSLPVLAKSKPNLAPKPLTTAEVDVPSPVGSIMPFIEQGPPDTPENPQIHPVANVPEKGWLFCNGAALPIPKDDTQPYWLLYRRIGTKFGAGADGQTFRLPDLRSRFPLGAGHGVGLSDRPIAKSDGKEHLEKENLPPHSHEVSDPGHTHVNDDTNGDHRQQFYVPSGHAGSGNVGSGSFGVQATQIQKNKTGITINNTGNGTEFMPPYLVVDYIIKVKGAY